MSIIVQRRFPIGAEVSADETHFRVWAPRKTEVEIIIEGASPVSLKSEHNGYFSGFSKNCEAGTLYRFRLDRSDRLYPDPASRFQPDGPHGPSQVIDPSLFRWTDDDWTGVSIEGQILYEMHVGTFTREGTWNAAAQHLPRLAEVGITALEIMPIASFPGRFGWGYDGVDLFAPTALYGSPDDFRRFVDHAHSIGLGVILDVVYNHLGPDGNYLKQFSPSYFTDRYANEWGESINYDGPESGPVREFFRSNARYWIDEFHLDGLRLDATQQIFDSSPTHIIREIGRAARKAAGRRTIILIAENEPQCVDLVRPEAQDGYGLDAVWNDDFHHVAHVAMTAQTEAYFSDYRGTPQEFISALKWGYLYQGQYYRWQKKRRGTPAFNIRPPAFVHYIQNHDQVANSPAGGRVLEIATDALYRAITGVLLLSAETPMLFQGQEFGTRTPFPYFADHKPALAHLVQQGRATFLRQFPSIADSGTSIPMVGDSQVFENAKLNQTECTPENRFLTLHRDLIRLRKTDPVFRAQRNDWMYGAVLNEAAFVLRFFGHEAGDRLIVVNLGPDLQFSPAPEPLLAEPRDCEWRVAWHSESPVYGGCGRKPLDEQGVWTLTAQSTIVLCSVPHQGTI